MALDPGRVVTSVVGACVLAAVAVGCADSGYQYVKNSEQGAYFKVPDDWELFDLADQDGEPRDRPAPLDLGAPKPWQIAFDAAPDPSVEHLSDNGTEHPVGLAEVRPLTAEVRDRLDLAALRSLALGGQGDPLAVAGQNDVVEVVEYEDITTGEGYRGGRVVLNLRQRDGTVQTIDHTALLDPATTVMYRFLVTCSGACYLENRDEIERIVDSWQIRKD